MQFLSQNGHSNLLESVLATVVNCLEGSLAERERGEGCQAEREVKTHIDLVAHLLITFAREP